MRVTLCDVGPRDGLQNEPDVLAPAVRAELVDREDSHNWVSITGTAELTPEGAVEHIHKLARKYTGGDYPLHEGERRVLVRITPERVNPRS